MRTSPIRFVAAIGLVLLGVVSGAPAAFGQGDDGGDGDDDVRIEVEVGVDGHVSPSRSYPVVVDVTSSRLLGGNLVVLVETDFGPSRIQVPIEVAATTTKRYVVTAPPGTSFGGNVVARVTSGGDTIAERAAPVSVDQTGELVGVLPGLVPAMDRATVPLAIDVGVARLAELTTDVLAEGPLALEVYDQIASGPGDLDDLSEVDRRAITTWVQQGGHLLVDAAAGQPVALPDGFDPAPGSYRTIGLGRVVLTGGALAGGRWQEALFPTPTQSANEEGMLNQGVGFMGDVTSALARDAGFRLPGIFSLILVLGAYIVVVGPIAWFVGRRTGRATRVWIIVPAVAALVTGGLQLAGDEFKGSDDAGHITMVETGPDGAVATTSVFVASRGRGGTTVDLPAGWQVAVNPFMGSFDGRVTPLLRSGDGASVPVDPGSGGASVVRVRGPIDVGDSLAVTATSGEDGVVRGTVENQLDAPLDDVAVFISRSTVVDVGDLDPGETKEWEADDATRFDINASPEASVWPSDMDPRAFGGGPVAFDFNGNPIPGVEPEDDPTSSLSGFADLTSVRGSNFKPPGEAVAVGWTRGMDAPVRVGGDVVRDGRTGFVARATITAEADRMTDTMPVRFVLRGPDANAFGGGAVNRGGVAVVLPAPPLGPPVTTTIVGGAGEGAAGEAGAAQAEEIPFDPSMGGTGMFGFLLPDAVGARAVDAARLRLSVPGLFAGAQVWTPGGWVDLGVTRGGDAQEVDLPDEAVVQGQVFVRMQIPFDQMPGPGRELVLYEVAA